MWVSCGKKHCLCIDNEGICWNIAPQDVVEEGSELMVGRAIMVPALREIVAVSCGNNHFACLDLFGNVWTFGGNFFGQLGLLRSSPIPQMIEGLEPMRAVACGPFSTACVDIHDHPWAFGQIVRYLGENLHTPIRIPGMEQIIQVSLSAHYILMLHTSGVVWGLGNNIGEKTAEKHLIPCKLPKLKDIISISSGISHSVFLTSTGKVYSCGEKLDGRLGLGGKGADKSPKRISRLSNIVSVHTGSKSSFFVDKERNLWGTGVLGTIRSTKPIKVMTEVELVGCGADFLLLRTTDGAIHVCGSGSRHLIDEYDEGRLFHQLSDEYKDILSTSSPGKNQPKSARK